MVIDKRDQPGGASASRTTVDDSLSLFFCYARSGGTLLNQCMGCIQENIVLSEVNPAMSYIPMEKQAIDWFHLLDEEEKEKFIRLPYAEKIRLLDERCRLRGQRLVIRDWVTVNFLPGAGHLSEPSGVLEQEIYLAGEYPCRRTLVFARRASAVFRSLQTHIYRERSLDERIFAKTYLSYAEAVASHPCFHLEDFLAEPVKIFRDICRTLGCAFDENFLTRFSEFRHCSGNNTLRESSRSANWREIHAAAAEPGLEAFTNPEALAMARRADQLLRYE